MNTQISIEAQRVLELGRTQHWHFRVVGKGEMPSAPYYKDQWWYLPLTPDINVPEEGKRRLEALRRAGVHIQGVIVAHETPKLLTTDKTARKKPEMATDFKSSTLPDIVRIFGALASAFVTFCVWLIGTVFSTALLIDPALVVVLEGGERILVFKWLNSTSL